MYEVLDAKGEEKHPCITILQVLLNMYFRIFHTDQVENKNRQTSGGYQFERSMHDEGEIIR